MDTKLYARNQPGGLFSIVNREAFPIGDIWWVDSTHASAADSVGAGRSPDLPFATWVYAETQVAAGDTCFLMPGHTETIGITGAAAILLNLAGVKYIGLGPRNKKPAILIDGFNDTYVSITGADTVLENICFKAGHADIAKAISVGAKGVEIRNCDFLENVVDENFKICIDDGAANVSDRLLVEGCTFVSIDASNTHAISLDAAQDRVIIRNNFLSGLWLTAAIGGVGVPTNILIENNYIQNIDTVADQCILLGNGSTGCVVRNLVGSYLGLDATDNIYVGTGCMLCENYSVDCAAGAGDVQGKLDPAAT